MAWSFSSSNAATVKLWSTEDTRDSEKSIWWYPLFFADDKFGAKAQKAGMKAASKWKGIVRFFSEFEQGRRGDRISVPHVPKVTGRGVRGDAMLRGKGQPGTTLMQDLYLDFFATQVYSEGPLSEQRVALDFIDTYREELRKWYTRTWEEALVLAQWGLTTWANTTVLENWNNGTTGEANVFNSDIETFDSQAISYAGDATSDSDIDSADVLTAQFLSKLRTQIRQGRDFPVEPVEDGKGKPCWLFVTDGRGVEQLKADQQFRENFTRVIKDDNNPLTQRADFYYDGFYIAEYEKCLQPAANVMRSLILGADSLMLAKHKGIKYFIDPADDAERRDALSVTGSGSVKAHKVASTAGGTARRRNAHAVDHYVRDL
jgi:hypothetical protein